MTAQIATLRRGIPFNCGDARSEQRYLRRVQKALREQKVRYAVAPMVVLSLPDGRSLRPGTLVRLQDLRGWRGSDGYGVGPRAAMARLVRLGRVLERTDMSMELEPDGDPPPRAA